MIKTLIFTILSVTLIAQKHYPTDSLEAMLDHAKDSLRAVLLYKIAKNDYNNNPSKCIRYAEEAAAIAEKRGDKKMLAPAIMISVS